MRNSTGRIISLGMYRYSKSKTSPLVSLFASRVDGGRGRPDVAMSHLITQLRKSSKQKGLAAMLDHFLVKRRVLRTEFVTGLNSDGCIEPIGLSFRDGFRMMLKRGAPQTRTRFTIAHELCHTFLYEIVPELKFGSQEVDEAEERLCNLGAAELLIPARSVRAEAKTLNMSIDSLEKLAAMYVVSSETMLLRLRSLKLWNCELSFWRRMVNGNFSMDRMIGGRKLAWVWADQAPLKTAWNTSSRIVGRTYLELRDSDGALQLRPVYYQLLRRGEALISLWSAKLIEQERESLPLFCIPLRA
jgi:hypothetical protein